MPLFEVAIIEKPTKKELEEGTAVERLVFGPQAIMAKDSQMAAIIAVRGETAEFDPNRSEVIVRPFA